MLAHIKQNTEPLSQAQCFHCGLSVQPHDEFEVLIDDVPQKMCCPGCQAVAQVISDAGLSDYYRFRDPAVIRKPDELVPEELQKISLYEQDNIRSRYVSSVSSNIDEVTLMLDGLTCAACAWLIENQLNKLTGIEDVNVNYSSMTATVRWHAEQTSLANILTAIHKIGYSALPYEPRIQYQKLLLERKQQIKRIGITAALGMQVMIISVALYYGDHSGMEQQFKNLFHKVGLLLTLPVMIYSAQTFFKASTRQILHLQPGMDVPVSLGLLMAFSASVWTSLSGQGEIYYDSVVMFVFFLLVARFFMLSSRLNASHSVEKLALSTPLTALRLVEHNLTAQAQSISAQELNPGDWVRVLAGHTLPADGIVINGSSTINKSIVSGEGNPVKVDPNDAVIAGCINNNNPLVIEVTASGENTVLYAIKMLAKKNITNKSSQIPSIDKIARWFVFTVLVLALTTAAFWWHIDPERWLAITVSVLVVSCPCALSLAVPAAHSTTNSKLLEKGMMLTNNQTLEQLTHINHVIFDKTGTLTSDNISLNRIMVQGKIAKEQCLKIAACLEVNSEHLLARAIVEQNKQALSDVVNWQSFTGMGVRGKIDSEQYFLGSKEFIQQQTRLPCDIVQTGILAILANDREILAEFHFNNSIRDGVEDLIDYFKQLGKTIMMITGDAPASANRLAEKLNINSVYSACKPQDKLDIVKDLQHNERAVILMIGDGINDSPVLAIADVSIAVAGASPLAVSGADIVMVNPSLSSIIDLHRYALKTCKIIRQNICWAIGYNLFAIPFAAIGLVKPLFAAIGMSISSLIVVLNALRLRKQL